MATSLQDILMAAVASKASDAHLVAGVPPVFRIRTAVQHVTDIPALTAAQLEAFVVDMAGEVRLRELQRLRSIDFSTQIDDVARFRVNAHFQRNSVGLSFRLVPEDVPALDELNLPPIVKTFVDIPQGLIIVAGQAGDGKTTTMAALIDAINKSHPYHIVTIEDPIEYLHSNKKSLVEQMELGRDVVDFAQGIRTALRQDPDVLVIGEMRDVETITAAMTAAETGHLVLASLHTGGASQVVERILDAYDAQVQDGIRAALANSLHAVLGQILFRRVDKEGMIPACSVMMATPAIRNCIRDGRLQDIPNIMQTGRDDGMCLFDEAILELYRRGHISREQALGHVRVFPKLRAKLCA